MESQLVINNQLINYFSFNEGKKPTVIFLHGWGSSSWVWRGLADKFSDDFCVFALDFPGFGKSSIPNKPFGVGDYAEIVKSFIEKKNLKEVILIGHSFGGRIAIKLSALHPELVKKIILIDSAGLILNKEKLSARKNIAKIVKPLFAPKFMKNTRDKIYQKIGSEDYVSNPELKDTFVKVINEDLHPCLPKIKAPTLLIWGENDKETPIEAAKVMKSEIKSSTLRIINNAGHFSFIDQPEECFQSINKFIQP